MKRVVILVAATALTLSSAAVKLKSEHPSSKVTAHERVQIEGIYPVKVEEKKVERKSFSPSRSRNYAKQRVSAKQWRCLNKLWDRESSWNHKAANPTSSAYGIPQLLKLTRKNPYDQIDKGLEYIRHRYGSACNAWEFWQNNNWY